MSHPEYTDETKVKDASLLRIDPSTDTIVAYEGFAEAWPPRGGEFADKMNSMPKHVVSSTLTDPEWENTSVIDGDVPTAVAKLREGDGGPILIAGSRTPVHSLAPTGLIDEYRLMIFPVVLGSGARVW